MGISINDIKIRTELKAGDIGYITYLHGIFHHNECGYGISFEAYVAEGLTEFFKNYNPECERMWICEHDNKIIGSLLLMNRGNQTAQLRYYIIEPEYRGIGLGRKLMDLFMEFVKEKNYRQCYLWTTDELKTASAIYLKYGFELSEEKESNDFGKNVTEQRYDIFL